MILYIAEKPSVGKALAEELSVSRRDKHAFYCQSDVTVSWCIGHILEQESPEQIVGKKNIELSDLPIYPSSKLIPKKNTLAQFKALSKHIKKASRIVHVGDPDREGQLLVDEVLSHCRYTGKVDRCLLSSLAKKDVRYALDHLRDNNESLFQGMSRSAWTRSYSDWTMGLNSSIALTRQSGQHLTAGRVQTALLSLLVDRTFEFDHFKSVDFFPISTSVLLADGIVIKSTLSTKPSKGIIEQYYGACQDSEGRILSQPHAKAIVDRMDKEGSLTVSRSDIKEKKQKPPLPFCLSDLQKEAGRQFGFNAKKVLSLAQTLYENKVITYPRSDCSYLPQAFESSIESTLAALKNIGGLSFDGVTAKKTFIFNDKKVSAHHAIVPTDKISKQSGDEQRLFSLIAQRYINCFKPDRLYRVLDVELISQQGLLWSIKAEVTTQQGWTNKAVSNGVLPKINKGDELPIKGTQFIKSETTPPPLFTDASIIDAMKNIHRYVDAKYKNILKDSKGLGTDATRAGIIDLLFHRGYAVYMGKGKSKSIRPTEKGQQVIAYLRSLPTDESRQMTNPAMTAVWEDILLDIEKGTSSHQDFIALQKRLCETLVNDITRTPVPKLLVVERVTGSCPECDSEVRRLKSKKKKGLFFWVCGECDAFFSDNKGVVGDKWEKKTKKVKNNLKKRK